jgi:hypothetical protein
MSGHAMHIKIDGRTYSGTYKVDRQVLTVTTSYGRKTAQVGPKVARRKSPEGFNALTVPAGAL